MQGRVCSSIWREEEREGARDKVSACGCVHMGARACEGKWGKERACVSNIKIHSQRPNR